MFNSHGFGNSNAPHTCNLLVDHDKLEQSDDGFVGELNFQDHLIKTLCAIKLHARVIHNVWQWVVHGCLVCGVSCYMLAGWC